MENNLSINMKSALSKVPEITLLFWITKILTTGMGEVFSDYLFFNKLDHKTALTLSFTTLVILLIIQFSVKKYVVWIYWLNVIAISVFGTMFADFIHEGLNLTFLQSTIAFIVFQAIIFGIWYISEKTLSIKSINTYRREAFYWATVLGTFALGTAAGDFTSLPADWGGLGWGAFPSGILFTILIAIPALSYKFKLLKMNEIFTFWFAYVMTRPLGASFSDWMSHELDWGAGPVSLGLTIIIIFLVIYMSITQNKIKEK